MAELINEKLEINEAEFERQFVEATKRGEKALREESRATAVRYDKKQKRVIIDLNTGATYIFPPRLAQGLSNATDEELADVKILGRGFVLEWTKLDEHFSIKGLLAGIFGNKVWMSKLNSKINGTENKPQKKVA
ncbi:MAG: DUF2442 domain-containing protein [Pyrinomonadaceae bacterium]